MPAGAVEVGAELGAERMEGAGAASAAGSSAVLLLQDDQADPAADREARRHGQAMLAALAALQRSVLAGPEDAALAQLAGLARAMPEAADPRLAAVQRAIRVRVAVELARGRAAASG